MFAQLRKILTVINFKEIFELEMDKLLMKLLLKSIFILL